VNKNEKRELQRKRLMDNKAYQTMSGLTRYMDRYYLDALIGIIPGWGDAIVLIVLLLLIALMIWALVSFGSYLYSLVSSIF
jgi:hypothetical protein